MKNEQTEVRALKAHLALNVRNVATSIEFYKKMFGSVTELFSSSSAEPVAETVQMAPLAPARMAPAAKAVPQKRADAAPSVKVATAH